MRKKKVNNSKKGNFAIYLGIVLIFVAAFIFLIDMQNRNNDDNVLADVVDGHDTLRTIEGRQIVVRDLKAIYPKYFVIYIDSTDNTYIVHSFNYYQTVSQYELEYNNHLNSIVDYNYNEYMIRYVYGKGEGTYNQILDTLSFIIGTDNYKIY